MFSLSYNILIAKGRIVGVIPFLGGLVQCQMKTALFRIWTQVVESTSYNNNYCTTSVSSMHTCLKKEQKTNLLFKWTVVLKELAKICSINNYEDINLINWWNNDNV